MTHHWAQSSVPSTNPPSSYWASLVQGLPMISETRHKGGGKEDSKVNITCEEESVP